MSEHLPARSIEQYLRRTLAPEELLRADDHLAACADCRGRAAVEAQTGRIFAPLYARLREAGRRAEAHLAYERIAAFVDGELDADERESVESHLTACPVCAAETDDLRAFSTALDAARSQQTELARPLTEKAGQLLLRLFAGHKRRFALTAATILLLCALSAALFLLLRPGLTWWPGDFASSRPTPEADVSHTPSPTAAPPAPSRPEDGIANEQGGQTSAATGRPTATPEDADAGERPEVALDDGGRQVTMDRRGRVVGLEGLPPSARREVSVALTGGQLAPPAALAQLRGDSGRLLGGAQIVAPFALLDPVGAIVRSDRPTLRWRPLDGATQYTVIVFDTNFNAVVKSPQLTRAEWSVPAALRRGQVYAWQVTAIKDGSEVTVPFAPAPEARFKVLGREQEEELVRVERARPRSHLARGVIYARVGLLEDAEREFRALLRDNPRSKVARRLLSSVRRLRRAG